MSIFKPVTVVTGASVGIGAALAGGNAFARGDAEQIGGAPHQIVLEFVHPPVREDDLPHHLDHADAARLIERAVDQAGEMIEVD